MPTAKPLRPYKICDCYCACALAERHRAAVVDRQPAHAAEITFRCVNPASGATWDLKIDGERQTADSLSAEITPTRVMWHDSVRGGFYELDRKSGLLTFRNASSTGGYMLYYRCQAN